MPGSRWHSPARSARRRSTGPYSRICNYGGGAGRSLLGSGGQPLANVRVELYRQSRAARSSTSRPTNAAASTALDSGNTANRGHSCTSFASSTARCARAWRTPAPRAFACRPIEPTMRQPARTVAGHEPRRRRNPALSDAASNTVSANYSTLNTATAGGAVDHARRSRHERLDDRRRRLRFQLRHHREHARRGELYAVRHQQHFLSVPGKPAPVHHQRERARRRRLARAGGQRPARRRAPRRCRRASSPASS